MSPKANTPSASVDGANLSERAMLVDLTIGYWEGRKKDKRTTTEVVDENHAAKDAGAWWTRIVPPKELEGIGSAISQARTAHARMTLPWMDGGVRILPAAMFLAYTETMRKLKANFEKAVNSFVVKYPLLVHEGKARLGGLFDAKHYPTAEELRARHYWTISFLPLPTAGDFRVDLGSVTEEVRESIRRTERESMEGAMSDLWDRLFKSVKGIADRLGNPDAQFRAQTIENLADLCELLPKMNVTADPKLEKMRAEVLRKLSGLDAQAVREDKGLRATAAKDAEDILKKMKGFMA